MQQILQIEPSDEVLFEGPFTGVVSRTLILKNPSSENVFFKIKTNAVNRYCVKPIHGIVNPHEEASISISLQPFDHNPEEDLKHKFLVQSVIVSNGEVCHPDKIWNMVNPQDVMETKVRCVLEMAKEVDKDDSKPSESFKTRKSSSSKESLRLENNAKDGNISKDPVTQYRVQPSSPDASLRTHIYAGLSILVFGVLIGKFIL